MHITTPLTPEVIRQLHAGDTVTLSGTIYTARDAAHMRMMDCLDRGESLPFDPRGQVVYYAGPTPARPGEVVGAIGPTTSVRMDMFTPRLLDQGLAGMIGKGGRGPAVVESMRKNGAVYFIAIGGAAALMAGCIRSLEVIAWDDLGPESVKKLQVENLPLVVAIDAEGRNAFEEGQAEYRAMFGSGEACKE